MALKIKNTHVFLSSSNSYFFPSSMNASTGLILTINIKVIFIKKSFSIMVDELDHTYFLSLLFVNLRIERSLCTMSLVMKIKHN